MSLPENTTYRSNFTPTVPQIAGNLAQAGIQAQKQFSQSPAGRGKQIDVSQFGNLAGRIGSAARRPQQMGGPMIPPRSTGAPGAGQTGTVTTPYGSSTRYEKFHPGIDIANKMGTPVGATVSGRVTQVVGGKRQGDPGFGNYVIVTDAEGNKHRYSHLQQSYVAVGQPVTRGAAIGTMGNTGQTYSQHGGDASHLDYRVRNLYGKYVNPLTYLS